MAKELPFQQILENKENLPWSVYLGVGGMPGKTIASYHPSSTSDSLEGATAYMAWKEYAHAKAGQTVFVTTAGGTSVIMTSTQ